jgi:hypothetical protein
MKPVIADHACVDLDAIMVSFADDALGNDSRESSGATIASVRSRRLSSGTTSPSGSSKWPTLPIGTVSVGRFDGDYDKTGPSDPLIKTTYFRIRSGKIVTFVPHQDTEPKY